MMRKKNGLTLVEVLIASSIFVLVMAAVYSAFHAGMFGYRRIEEAIDVHQSARKILERINLDLRNSFVFSEEESKFSGEKSKVSFFALVDTFSKDKMLREYAYVSYYLKEGKLMRSCCLNKDALNERPDTKAEEMSARVGGLLLSYAYIDDDSDQIKWKDSWEDKKGFPLAVKVKLVLGNRIKQEFVRSVFLP